MHADNIHKTQIIAHLHRRENSNLPLIFIANIFIWIPISFSISIRSFIVFHAFRICSVIFVFAHFCSTLSTQETTHLHYVLQHKKQITLINNNNIRKSGRETEMQNVAFPDCQAAILSLYLSPFWLVLAQSTQPHYLQGCVPGAHPGAPWCT